MEIYVPKQEDERVVVKLLNRAFHKSFPKLLPGIYDKNPENMKEHLCIKNDEGELVGGLCRYEQKVRLSEKLYLKCAAVGMVATDKKARGQGVMTSLLKELENKLKEEDFDMAYLGGSRQRYGRFEYFPVLTGYCYKMVKSNTRNISIRPRYTFEKIKASSIPDELYGIYTSQRQFVERSKENLGKTLQNWFATKNYLVRKDGEIFGLLNTTFYRINYLFLADESLAGEVALAFLRTKGYPQMNFVTIPSQKEAQASMEKVCQYFSAIGNKLYMVVNFRSTMEKLLKQRLALYGAIPSFNLKLDIEGERFAIFSDGKSVRTANYNGVADLLLSREEATTELLGLQPNRKLPFYAPFAVSYVDFI